MSRILNRQRQLAEQGRLRLGYTVPHGDGKTRPVRSETWVVTSHSEEHVRAAAQLWGGEVERWQPMGNGAEQWRVITEASSIDAILPPGDPLTQAYETWSKGGCQRRCNGVTEEFTGSPCLCLAAFGERWFEQPKGTVCDSKSRLKVLLPDMPGLGSWRVETGSYYATDEIAGMVDVIRGAVGGEQLVPVRLRIEQRTRTSGGKTRQFVVPVLELRGVTAGALLTGQLNAPAVGNGASSGARPALEQGHPDYVAEAQAATSLERVQTIWRRATATGHMTPELEAALRPLGDRFANGNAAAAADPDVVWQQIVTAAGELDMDLSMVEQDFAALHEGTLPDTATAAQLQGYLEQLQAKVALVGAAVAS